LGSGHVQRSGQPLAGLTDEAVETNFVWVSGEAFAYANWNTGEPNNSGNEDYAAMLAPADGSTPPCRRCCAV